MCQFLLNLNVLGFNTLNCKPSQPSFLTSAWCCSVNSGSTSCGTRPCWPPASPEDKPSSDTPHRFLSQAGGSSAHRKHPVGGHFALIGFLRVGFMCLTFAEWTHLGGFWVRRIFLTRGRSPWTRAWGDTQFTNKIIQNDHQGAWFSHSAGFDFATVSKQSRGITVAFWSKDSPAVWLRIRTLKNKKIKLKYHNRF